MSRVTDGVMDEDELYAEAPDQFVAARAAAAEAARQEGDAARAKAIAALRKPTVGAWLVNRLALKRPDLVKGLAELAGSLRSAQRELKGEKLRELARQRRDLIASLVDESRKLAIEADPGLAKRQLPMTEVEATLNAALADKAIAEQVQTGRLLKTTAYAGFGELPSTEDDADGEAAARPSTGELRAAQRKQADAERDAERAAAAEDEAKTELDAIDERLAELRERRKAAADEFSELRKQHTAAQRALTEAQRRVSELER